MNIRDAATQLEQAVRAYGARTPEGAYRVSLASQRPVYLMGPPGLGKTAVVAQVAAKLGIGYAAYTMTHHTRQSALGLPLIAHRRLNGEERAVTEYTVSEIVASVWRKAEGGAEAGLLFLDEINCVSESLMPAMLQLLQYKTFGVHALPRGWMLVCAGNPPRYNRYAHTFDAVVMDRLRVVEVEPDFEAWQAFAIQRGAHPLVRSYLAMRREDFYVSDGDRIVTARSWTDLSDLLLAMEAEGIPWDEGLYGQYLQAEGVAERFAQYARLCADTGARLDEALEAADGAPLAALPFDEAIFAALFLAGRLEREAEAADRAARASERTAYFAEGVLRDREASGRPAAALCADHLERRRQALIARTRAGAMDEAERAREEALLARLESGLAPLRALGEAEAERALGDWADGERRASARHESAAAQALGRGLDFIEGAFPDPNVRLLLLNDLNGHEAARRLLRARHRERFDALLDACDPDARLQRYRREARPAPAEERP